MTSKVPDPSLGEPTVTYAYNANGTRSTMTDASGTTTYTYDTRNRLLTKATPEGTLTYTYDASGNVASIDSSNANGTSVAYAWDAANQLVDGDRQPARRDDDGGVHGDRAAVRRWRSRTAWG